jgi:hypothetical protein
MVLRAGAAPRSGLVIGQRRAAQPCLDLAHRHDRHQLSTPAQWQPGDAVIIAGSVGDEEAERRYPDGWEQPLPYMRIVGAP